MSDFACGGVLRAGGMLESSRIDCRACGFCFKELQSGDCIGATGVV